MVWFLIALVILFAGGIVPIFAGKQSTAASLAGMSSVLAGCGIVLFQSLAVLISGNSQSLHGAWSLPFGSAAMAIDPLSAVFAAAIATVVPLAAMYGFQYLRGRHNLGISWFFFNLLAASMFLVVAARNGVLFLISWELMSLASFFLVAQDDEKESVRRASWIYLVAMHLGTAFLLALFLLLGKDAGSLDFNGFSTVAAPPWVFFLLALIGFGTKAGFIPMHVWLPEAHPAAPSHVSAVMSGVMIKTGIYGLLRVLTILGPPAVWWGWLLVGIGAVSGIFGVLQALSQNNLKRLLAYCSVENIGVITLGIGVGVIGIASDNRAMAFLDLTGALLHVVNHAVFKSLLFLGAGSVIHAAGTGDIDRLGGLLKRMPVTGTTFLIGAAAISGLPPLNGFISEFLIFLGAVAGLGSSASDLPALPLVSVLAVGGLALIGGLAAACFTKAFGVVFLGEPRSDATSHAHEAGPMMRWPMIVLAGLCVLIGLTAPLWPILLQPAVAVVAPNLFSLPPETIDLHPEIGGIAGHVARTLCGIVFGSCFLLGLIGILVYARRRLLQNRPVQENLTWGCGYVAPTPRMQYTASSFARPLVLLFRFLLQPRDEIRLPRGLFPKKAALHTHTPDLFRRYGYEPLFAAIAWAASKLRWLQEGRIQIYVLYIALTILILLFWKLG